jgi:serine protease
MYSIRGRPLRIRRVLPAFVRVAAGASLLLIVAARCNDGRNVTLYDGREVRDKEVLIKFGPPLNALSVESLARTVKDMTDGRVKIERVGGLDVFRVTSTDLSVQALIELFNRHKPSHAVEYVEPNHVLHLDAAPDDSLFENLWGLSNEGQALKKCGDSSPPVLNASLKNADTDAVEAWELTGDREVVVAVLDSGLDLNHVDLQGALWSAPRDFTVVFEKDGRRDEIKCPAGTHGFNLLADGTSTNGVDSRCVPADNHGHGTEVAGIIAAVSGNHEGVAGVAGNRSDGSGNVTARVKIMPIKIAEGNDPDVSRVAAAIEFVKQVNEQALANVRVLNNSYGFTCKDKKCNVECSPQTLKDAVSRTDALNLLFVASAGKSDSNNDCLLHYPSSYLFPNIVAVAASDNQDNLAYSESNFGPQRVHIAAPGIGICTTAKGTTAKDSRYVYAKGTSLSAAFVSGAAALLLTRCERAPRELKEQLLSSTDTDHFKPDPEKPIARGRLNILNAIKKCGT